VAPDHPELKTASKVFEKTAAKEGFRFFGNVGVGRDVGHDELLRLYDAVVYTVGAQTDRRLGIPGEELAGSWAATEFVAWYNGHPDYQHLEFDLSSDRAIVIGNGNVAVDVARILARTEDELAPTDITDRSAAALVASSVTEIVMLGRRGPAQAAFTPPELKELGELGGADVFVDAAELELDSASEASLETAGARARRTHAGGETEAARPSLLRLAGADPRRGTGRGDRGCQECARRRR
jgi:ferredoxin--NADP+ reductase